MLRAEQNFNMIGSSRYLMSIISRFPNVYYSAELIRDDISGTKYVLNLLNEDKYQQLGIILYVKKF